MVRVKICGITNLQDALLAIQEGAHALGFIFAQSPRQMDKEQVRAITGALPPFITKVGVFVEQSPQEILKITKECHLNAIQLHGDYSVEICKKLSESYEVIKVFRVANSSIIEQMRPYASAVNGFLLDTYAKEVHGGTGETFNWEIAIEAKKLGVPLILSGGLNPKNILTAIQKVLPYGVDLSSGVEKTPGKKDPDKIKTLFQQLHQHGEFF